jgi:O-acetyl-ADP-ribose deacetylase (regulator of RNase III)
MKYQEIKGNLITKAQEGAFDVIIHGCNCFNAMGAGLAPQMAKAFNCDKFFMESPEYKGSKEKLGTGDSQIYTASNDKRFYVINCYTQYEPGPNASYDALKSCLKQINNALPGEHIGIPQIGCGIGGLDWSVVRELIQVELEDCGEVTAVIFE